MVSCLSWSSSWLWAYGEGLGVVGSSLAVEDVIRALGIRILGLRHCSSGVVG